VKPLPYRLPEVLASIKDGRPIFIVEGEKDVETLRSHGYVATCNSGGAGKWTVEHAKWLKGADVGVIPDNDKPGLKHAELVKTSLVGIAERIHGVDLEGAKDVSAWFEKGGTDEDFRYLLANYGVDPDFVREPDAPDVSHVSEPKAGVSVDGAALLEDVRAFIARFVAFPEPHHIYSVTLWAAHTHMIGEFYTTPRLAMVSAEPESGKTRVLEILALLTPNPMLCFTPSTAAIFRKLDQEQITLLLDETDTVFNFRGKDDQNEDLRALLNAGYRRGASIPRCTGRNHEVTDFKVFAATALAGIGDMPDTIMTRSIIIRMKRRAAGEHIEQYRARDVDPEGHALRDRLAAWGAVVGSEAGRARLDLPGVTDRRAEAWEPLVAVADIAGGDWPGRARVAAVADVTAHRGRDGSLGIRLLTDLKTVFEEREVMATSDIITALVAMDGDAPWGDLKNKPIDSRGLAIRLKRYGIAPKVVRIGATTQRGYARVDLHDAWTRYLPTLPICNVTSVTGETDRDDVAGVTPVTSPRGSVPDRCIRCGGEGCTWCTT
jgi:hypothetical protein